MLHIHHLRPLHIHHLRRRGGTLNINHLRRRGRPLHIHNLLPPLIRGFQNRPSNSTNHQTTHKGSPATFSRHKRKGKGKNDKGEMTHIVVPCMI
jgi:hypothetical protein